MFVPAKLVQSDISPDGEQGQLMSVSQSTGSSVVAADKLKEQQAVDPELQVVRGWLGDPATVPNSNELHTHSPEV